MLINPANTSVFLVSVQQLEQSISFKRKSLLFDSIGGQWWAQISKDLASLTRDLLY